MGAAKFSVSTVMTDSFVETPDLDFLHHKVSGYIVLVVSDIFKVCKVSAYS